MLSQVIEQMKVNKTVGIWEIIMSIAGHNLHLLKGNSVVMIFKEWGLNEVLVGKIGQHTPPMQPWGIEFSTCRKTGCIWTASDFFTQSENYDICMECRMCVWKSVWVRSSTGKSTFSD